MLRLYNFDRSCYDTLISWINNAEDLMQFAGPALKFPLTHEQLDSSLSDPKRYAFRVVDESGRKAIGHAEIYLTADCAYLGRILVGNPASRGMGLGKEIVSNLLNYAFDILKQDTVQLNVFEWNQAAIRCYEKAGFLIDPGKKFERTVKGQAWKGFAMTINRKKWELLRLSQ
jgi:RimJ/RimL family protein N-acetyltransferase